MEVPIESGSLEATRGTSGVVADIPLVLIMSLVPIIHPSLSFIPFKEGPKSFSVYELPLVEVLECADPQGWEITQEVFKSLFAEQLEKLRVLGYDDLEKRMIMEVQVVFPI